MRIGVVHNPRSHRNKRRLRPAAAPGVLEFAPETPDALVEALGSLASDGIDVLIIDGGDGTVRDVLSPAMAAFAAGLPPLVVVPSGKTNALARDLGAPPGWTVEQAIAAIRAQRLLPKQRPVLQVHGKDSPALNGFIFGTGGFVRGVRLAQGAHKAGLFNDLAVVASIAAFLGGMLAGGKSAKGEDVTLGIDAQPPENRHLFGALASTLERLPAGVKPFGPPGPGLKLLTADAPPHRLARALPALLSGRDVPWLETAGYRRVRGRAISFSGIAEFVLDGEIIAASGDIVIREGPPIVFLAP